MESNISNEYKLSVIIYANDETRSLKKTIMQIISGVKTQYEIIVYLKTDKCLAAETVKEIVSDYPDAEIISIFQNGKDILESTFEIVSMYCSGTHYVVWTADDEISAKSLLTIAALSEKKRESIFCAAKFYKNMEIKGYGFVRTLVRKTLNFTVKVLYRKRGKDFFSMYQVVPRSYLNEMNFSSPKNFVYESTLIPLRLGKEYIEIPADFHKRKEGNVNFSIWFYLKTTLRYVYNIFKIRFTPKRKLKK